MTPYQLSANSVIPATASVEIHQVYKQQFNVGNVHFVDDFNNVITDIVPSNGCSISNNQLTCNNIVTTGEFLDRCR